MFILATYYVSYLLYFNRDFACCDFGRDILQPLYCWLHVLEYLNIAFLYGCNIILHYFTLALIFIFIHIFTLHFMCSTREYWSLVLYKSTNLHDHQCGSVSFLAIALLYTSQQIIWEYQEYFMYYKNYHSVCLVSRFHLFSNQCSALQIEAPPSIIYKLFPWEDIIDHVNHQAKQPGSRLFCYRHSHYENKNVFKPSITVYW